MTDEDRFLAAILAAPDDDTPRLVYADWLDDNAGVVVRCDGSGTHRHEGRVGQVIHGVQHDTDPRRPHHHHDEKCLVSDGRKERAEFIRVQCELARRAEVAGHRDTVLWARERELFEAQATGWLNPAGLTMIRLNPYQEEIRPAPYGIVRRGFVAEVRLPLAAFLGGRCERCGGRGRIYPHMIPRNLAEPCPNCRPGPPGILGTGTLPGLAADLFRRHPVERVVPTDKTPQDYGPDMHFWFRSAGRVSPDAEVGDDVYDHLEGYELTGGGSKYWRTAKAAVDALSAALVAIGRERAGLDKNYRPGRWCPAGWDHGGD
jgi:hypothetical protein